MSNDLSPRSLPLVAVILGLGGFGTLGYSSVLAFQDARESTGPIFETAVVVGFVGLSLVAVGIVLSARAVRLRTAFARLALGICVAALPVVILGYLVVLFLFYS
ncbi:hypothetical protein [Frondihabitans sp. 762G35]|uniref:hypothetical protein n=1 Tax=Frondihabitans sp. 762G35 TaxID=1446794 RepID=UPI000F4DE4C5|nr:hypothetical protein [Frondihabitans sp. 762G35]